MKKRRKIAYYLFGLLFFLTLVGTDGRAAALAQESDYSYPTGDLAPIVEIEMTEDVERAIEEAMTDVDGLRKQSSRDVGFYSVSEDRILFVPAVNAAGDYSSDYGYSQFSDGQKTLYQDFMLAIQNFLQGDYKTKDYQEATPVVITLNKSYSDYGITISEGLCVYFGIRHNYPEYYWIYPGYSDTYPNPIVFMHGDYALAATRTEMDTAIENGISQYVSALGGLSSDYEKVRALHDMLIENVEYAYKTDGRTPEDSAWAHNVVGVFVDKYTRSTRNGVVCEGYSKAFQLILGELGIENVYIVGDAGGGHAWNMVKLGTQYYLVDTTWDDIGDASTPGVQYAYFCIPSSKFSQRHSAYTNVPGNFPNWLYTLPTASEGMEGTYYSVYQTDFSNLSTADQMRSALSAASGLVPGDYIEVLLKGSGSLSTFQTAIAKSFSYFSSDIGYLVRVAASDYRNYSHPAASLTLDKSEAEVDGAVDASLALTAAMEPADTDDVVSWSVEPAGTAVVTSIAEKNKSVSIAFQQNGTYTVTARAVGGGMSAQCSVTVTGIEKATPAGAVEDGPANGITTVWINGATVTDKATKQKTMYKTVSWVTKLTPTNVTVTDSRGKTKVIKGKLVAGVTSTNQKPILVKGKIVDTNAALCAKATISSKGEVKVTAAKQAGKVYVWVIDTGDENHYSCTEIDIKTAAAKLTAYEDPLLTYKYKKATVPVGESIMVYFTGVENSKSTKNATECTYTYTIDEKSKNLIEISEQKVDGTAIALCVKAVGLDPSKPGRNATAKFTVQCVESNKKVTLSLTIVNPQMDYKLEANSSNGIVFEDGRVEIRCESEDCRELIATYKVTELLASNDFQATTKTKAYILGSENDFFIDERGKIKVTRPTGDVSKVKVTIKDGILTVRIPGKSIPANEFYLLLGTEPNYGYHIFRFNVMFQPINS